MFRDVGFCESCFEYVIEEKKSHCKSLNHDVKPANKQIKSEIKNEWKKLKKYSGKSKREKEQAKQRINELENIAGTEITKWDKLEKESSLVRELFDFSKENIVKLIVSRDDSSQVFAKINNEGHVETVNLDSSKSLAWLMYNYRKQTDELYNHENYKTALKHLKAEAYFNGTVHEKIYVRVAQTDNAIYYDLGRKDWEYVKITKQNYIIIPYSKTIPTFDRPRGVVEQVLPDSTTNNKCFLGELCKLLRIKNEMLFKIHLIHFFLQNQETPIMIITGEHGSVKTTTMQAIKKIVDPSSSNLGSLPYDKKELQSDLSNKYMATFDNVSGFDHEVSDIFCRAISGDEIAKRALYTDNELFVKSYEKKKIVLNGISPNIEFPDFNDRSIYYETSYIPESEKLSKSDFWNKFDEMLPFVLHQIFSTLSKMLASHEDGGKKIGPKSRMADFEQYGETISQSLGHNKGEFLEEYEKKRNKTDIRDLDSFPIVRLITAKVKGLERHEGLLTEFYKILTNQAIEEGINTNSRKSNWPQKPHFLTQQINRLKPQFRTLGYEIDIDVWTERTSHPDWHGRSVITIEKKKFSKSGQPARPAQPLEKYAQKSQQIGEDEKMSGPTSPTKKTSAQPKNDEITHKNNTGKASKAGKADSSHHNAKAIANHTHWECTRCDTGLREIGETSISSTHAGFKTIVEVHEKSHGSKVKKYTESEASEKKQKFRNLFR